MEKNAKEDIIKVLVGNCCDREDERKVSYQEGKNFAEANDLKFFEASAKTGQNVQEIFGYVVREIIDSQPLKIFYI